MIEFINTSADELDHIRVAENIAEQIKSYPAHLQIDILNHIRNQFSYVQWPGKKYQHTEL